MATKASSLELSPAQAGSWPTSPLLQGLQDGGGLARATGPKEHTRKKKKGGNVNPTPSHVHLFLAKLFQNNLQGTVDHVKHESPPPSPRLSSYSTPTPLHHTDALTSTETMCQSSGRKENKSPAHS